MKNSLTTEFGEGKFEVGDAYIAHDLLGQGPLGIVAAGVETGTGKKVAVKHIRPIAASVVGARHILREIITMRVLRCHPNIINIEDIRVDTHSGTLYIVMELMECDLQRVLASGQVLTAEHVQVLLKQLLLGVQAMHNHGILHRDLRLANILLLGDCQLRITDFGLSGRIRIPSPGREKQLAGGTVKDEANSTGYVVTTWYRAPEVILGSEGGDGKPADMWSVGCIFGEMLGSRGPLFPGNNNVDQVSLTLAAVGKADTASNHSLGYELGEDAVQLLRTAESPTGRLLESLVPSAVDEKAFDLLKALLEVNIQRRMTAAQALDHSFLYDCPRLPTVEDATGDHAAAAGPPGEHTREGAVELSFEDEDLTVEELGRLIATEAALYENRGRKSLRRNESLENDASPSVPLPRPTPRLHDIFREVRKQARCYKDREDTRAANAGEKVVDSDACAVRRLGRGSTSHSGAAFDPRFSSLANLGDAQDRGLDDLRRFFFNDIRPDIKMRAVSLDTAKEGCKANGSDRTGLATGDLANMVDAEAGKAEQPQALNGGGSISVEILDKDKRRSSVESGAANKSGIHEGDVQPEERDGSRERPSPPAPGEEPGVANTKKSDVENVVHGTETAAAAQTQATCHRQAAQNELQEDRSLLCREGVAKATASHRRATPHQQQQQPPLPPPPPSSLPPPKRNVIQRDGSAEEERAALVIQRSNRQAAAIRRARAEQERKLQAQQFLFGPGFQQPGCRTARSSGYESGRYSERRKRSREKASLTPSEEEEDERRKSSNRAATKIQAHARRKAASRRAVAARQRMTAAARNEAAEAETLTPVPRLPIESSVLVSAFSGDRSQAVALKVQREPLAILRQLRDDPDVQPAPKTDQFRLRMTIKSAIEAHIKKTGAPRRKPRPLPIALTYRQNAALMKLKSQQQQQQLRAEATRIPLAKRRVASPLHRSVRQVNTFIAATDKQRGRPTAGPGPRAQSAPPSRATDRLRCAIHAAETMVEREYERAQRRPSLIRDRTPVDELSRDLLASPLLVPYSPPV